MSLKQNFLTFSLLLLVVSCNVAVFESKLGPRPASIMSITPPPNGIYQENDQLNFTVTMSAPVVVNGAPTISLIIGASTVNANYVSGSGTASLVFRYTLAPNEYDVDGILLELPINLNGGSIKTTTDATLSFLDQSYSGVLVDARFSSLAWSPLSNNFGNVVLGQTSITQDFTLTNSGAEAATSCSAPTITDATNFTITADTCSSNNLAATGTCVVTIQGNPTTTGTKSTSLYRTCDVGGSATTTLNQLVVTGTYPALAFSPLSYGFGNISVGANSSSQTFTITNSGTADASGCSAPTLTNLTDFSIVTDNCSTNNVTASGGTCTVLVRANPATAGIKSTTLSRSCVVSGVVSTDSNQITTTGTPSPVLAWSPLTHAFGNVTVGSNSSNQTFTLTNSGTGDATGCSAPALSNLTDFSIVTDNCGTANVTASGGTCTVLVRANPASVGAKTATLSRSCTIGGATSTTTNGITVTGLGLNPTLSWVQSTMAFGEVSTIKSSATLTAELINSGEGSATGCSVPALTNNTDFTIVTDNCSTSNLAPGDVCSVLIRANPGTVGAKTATLSRTCTLGGTVSTNSNGLTTMGRVSTSVPVNLALNLASAHSCVLMSDQTVKCWGNNNFGQLGDGTTTQRTTPVAVSGISTATQIANGSLHSCALLANQTVKCWGYNSSGQLGDGTTDQSLTPVTVLGISTATQIALGSNNTCALLSDQTIKCWGENGYGQLGDGTTDQSLTPVTVLGISTATQIATGNYHTCALLADQTAKCWGYNGLGQLGDGTQNQALTPVTVVGVSTATQIATGNSHTCVLLADQTLKCGGFNFRGQLGDGTTTLRTTLVPVSGITTATQIITGDSHTCAILADQTARCWGENSFNKLGDGTTTNRNIPVAVLGVSNVSKMAAGISHTCALLTDQTIKCWGHNGSGRLGDGSTTTRASPTTVSGIATATQIATGLYHTCSLLTDQTVKCWGYNATGELGDGTTTNTATPVMVSGISTATQIAAGYYHTCALLADQTVKCWGANVYGHLGNGTTVNSSTPVTVSGISTATQIAAGTYHTCALLVDKSVKCWGYNNFGQIGDGTTTNRNTPVVVSGISNANQVMTGEEHTCALHDDKTIKCWGKNWSGQLGDGTGVSSSTPVSVSGISTATQIATGQLHTCALLVDQSVKCWGYNLSGQVGDGTTTLAILAPVTVSGNFASTQITTGARHTCALIADQSVKCWGENFSAQLGDRTTTNKSSPTIAYGLFSVIGLPIGSGSVHNCVILSDTTVQCWGNNDYSQTGFNEFAKRNVSGF